MLAHAVDTYPERAFTEWRRSQLAEALAEADALHTDKVADHLSVLHGWERRELEAVAVELLAWRPVLAVTP